MSEVKPYNIEGESKKKEVKQMFDNIAPYYDLLNRVLSLGIDVSWRKKALKMIKADNPQAILDVATGTGDLAIMAARRLNPRQVMGVDIAPKMLDVARKKADHKDLDVEIAFEEGDAENLRFESNSFDAVTVAFGVRNFGDLEKGLNELKRVLRDNGKLVILEFTKPRHFPFKQLYHFYFRNILPFVGKITSKDPRAYRYLFESVMAFPDYDLLKEILLANGFKKVEYTSLTLGICAIYVAEK